MKKLLSSVSKSAVVFCLTLNFAHAMDSSDWEREDFEQGRSRKKIKLTKEEQSARAQAEEGNASAWSLYGSLLMARALKSPMAPAYGDMLNEAVTAYTTAIDLGEMEAMEHLEVTLNLQDDFYQEMQRPMLQNNNNNSNKSNMSMTIQQSLALGEEDDLEFDPTIMSQLHINAKDNLSMGQFNNNNNYKIIEPKTIDTTTTHIVKPVEEVGFEDDLAMGQFYIENNDLMSAQTCLLRAIEKGSKDAIDLLQIYCPPEQNLNKAYFHMLKAAEGGHEEAISFLKQTYLSLQAELVFNKRNNPSIHPSTLAASMMKDQAPMALDFFQRATQKPWKHHIQIITGIENMENRFEREVLPFLLWNDVISNSPKKQKFF